MSAGNIEDEHFTHICADTAPSTHLCDVSLQNDKGLVPADVVPDPMDMSLDKAEAAMVAKELRQLLLEAVPLSCNLPRATLPNYDNIPGNLMLSSLGLKLGERVLLDDMKVRGTNSELNCGQGGSGRIVRANRMQQTTAKCKE